MFDHHQSYMTLSRTVIIQARPKRQMTAIDGRKQYKATVYTLLILRMRFLIIVQQLYMYNRNVYPREYTELRVPENVLCYQYVTGTFGYQSTYRYFQVPKWYFGRYPATKCIVTGYLKILIRYSIGYCCTVFLGTLLPKLQYAQDRTWSFTFCIFLSLKAIYYIFFSILLYLIFSIPKTQQVKCRDLTELELVEYPWDHLRIVRS